MVGHPSFWCFLLSLLVVLLPLLLLLLPSHLPPFLMVPPLPLLHPPLVKIGGMGLLLTLLLQLLLSLLFFYPKTGFGVPNRFLWVRLVYKRPPTGA
jgi:hypothetical protein